MLWSVFVSSSSPVMVQETNRKAQSRKFRICVQPSTVNFLNAPVFCKVKFRKSQSSAAKTKLLCHKPDSTMDFPFLHDPQTVKLLKKSKILFIMRGLPGSGKSTLVRAIDSMYDSSVICSADDYFLRDGEYKFDVAGLGSAHGACQNKAKDACNADVAKVVVDNTNVRRWEMKFYLELAGHRNYVVILVEPRTSWKWNPAELAARNKHGVDVETLKRKVDQFDNIVPVYYGWFLNESSSKQLSFIASYLLKECVNHYPGFTERLLKQLHISSVELQHSHYTSDDASPFTDTVMSVLKEYYTGKRRVGCLLHCTAKFCGGGRAVGAKTYHAQYKVENSLGQAFKLEIPSICFSPRSVGARVQLTEDQLSLFDKPEEKDWNGRELRGAAKANGSFQAQRKSNSPEQGKNKSKKSQSARNSPRSKAKTAQPSNQDGIPSQDRSSPPFTTDLEPAFTKPLAKSVGRSAHITIGSGPGFESRETNFDVLRLCDMEAEKPGHDSDFVPVTGGKARYFGDGVCCVYFEPPLQVSSIYSGHY